MRRTGLAARIDTLEHTIDALTQDVAALCRGTAELTAHLRRLTGTTVRSSATGTGVGPGAGEQGAEQIRQPDWVHEALDAETAMVWLRAADAFATSVLPALGHPMPAPCWPLHPEVVTELLALATEHAHSYASETPTAVCEWLGRWLPGAIVRIHEALNPCASERGHRQSGRTYLATDLDLDSVATWWATNRRQPAPEAFALPAVG